MQKDKIESLLGFAVKAGKTVYGIDGVETYKKRCYIMFICSTAADNTKKKAIEFAGKKHIPIILTDKALELIVFRKNCKVLAVTDKQMAEAMLSRVGENYHLISSEVK